MRSRRFLAAAIAGGAIVVGGYGSLVYLNRAAPPDGSDSQYAKTTSASPPPLSAVPPGSTGTPAGSSPAGNAGTSPDPLAAVPTAIRPPSRDLRVPLTSREVKEEARKRKEAWYASQGRLDEYRAGEKAREEKRAARAAERKQRREEAGKKRAAARKHFEDMRNGRGASGGRTGDRPGEQVPQE